jgi:hypothetical protein
VGNSVLACAKSPSLAPETASREGERSEENLAAWWAAVRKKHVCNKESLRFRLGRVYLRMSRIEMLLLCS